MLLLLVGIVGCGSAPTLPAGAGNGASIKLSLNTVPFVRSVTVRPTKGTFGNCQDGSKANWTPSTQTKLGYPNGRCWFGVPEPNGYFPIFIQNSGIASRIDVYASSADPSDDGTPWNLCNSGNDPAVACRGREGTNPGQDQYRLVNFGPDGTPNWNGLTGDPSCDHEFGPTGGCWASHAAYQDEGVEIIGPSLPTDTAATSWTMTITWVAVPR